MRLGVISLGCDKATVDSERLLGELVGHGARIVSELETADVVRVNTCGFIDAVKRESIEAKRLEHESALEHRSRNFLRILAVVLAVAAVGAPWLKSQSQ